MKLLTLNCHSWQEDNQIEKIRCLAQTIKEEAYDVIALQEVSQLIEDTVVDGQIKKSNFGYILLTELEKIGVIDYSFIWDFSHIGFEIYEEGLAILTKHPIIEADSFFITGGTDTNYWKTRKIIGATIDYHHKPVSFYSCHMGWWNDKEEPFKQQFDSLLQQVNKNGLFFLLGDFNNNANFKNEGYDYMLNQSLYDTYHLAAKKDDGITVKGKITGWDANKQDLRIDFIMANQSLAVEYSQVIFNDRNRSVISDHYGVEIKLTC